MAYQESTFCGDAVYSIDCTGDVVVGDHVAFERAVFSGSFKKPKFSHFEMVRGVVTAESYGSEKQQHTFTISLDNGRKTLIKGRNLYKNGTFRQPWADETARRDVAREKHARGDFARAQRQQRKELWS